MVNENIQHYAHRLGVIHDFHEHELQQQCPYSYKLEYGPEKLYISYVS